VVLHCKAAPLTSAALQSLYAHTLHALRYHGTSKLFTNQIARQPLPAHEQQWLIAQWVPQAIAEYAYSQCALAESAQTGAHLAARAVGEGSPITHSIFGIFPTKTPRASGCKRPERAAVRH
jgi:hypothetical protein